MFNVYMFLAKPVKRETARIKSEARSTARNSPAPDHARTSNAEKTASDSPRCENMVSF